MGRKLRVLILSKELHFGGGVANFVAMLLANLSDSIEWEHFTIGEPHSGKGGLRKLGWPLIDNPRLLMRLLRRDIDCLQINPSMNWNAFMRDALLLMTARAAGFKNIVVFFHGWDENFVGQVGRRLVYRVLLQRVYGTAAVIIVLAERFKQQLLTMGLSRDRILVSTTMFDGSIFEGVERRQTRGVQSRHGILFLSRFIKEKGVFELLEAFGQVHQRFPTTELVLAGDGPTRHSMERYVREHGLTGSVIFAGYLRGADKARILKNSEIFVLPTTYPEGCPVAVLEAMAAGLPVVTTPIGGIPDIFVDRKNGILLHSVSPREIAGAISKLLNDTEWRAEIGRYNQAIAWETYEARIVSEKIMGIYREVAAGSR